MADSTDDVFRQIFSLSPGIRYIAIYRDGSLESREAAGIRNSSSSESDKYEELIVNPTLLKLVQQRGEIDCGGASYVVVGYGNFRQLVVRIPGGHASVAFELGSDPLMHVESVRSVLVNHSQGTESPGQKA